MRIHQDIIENKAIGSIGGCHAAYYGLADTLYNTQVTRNPNRLTKTTLTIPHNQQWNNIVTFDPMGFDGPVPTIASTTCNMSLPELPLPIKVTKIAIEQAWSISGIAKRLNVDESTLRNNLYHRSYIPDLLDPTKDTFLPQIGGTTVYIFGDYNARTAETKIAARVHDECNGSDCFGTDICTCRPYLIYAIKELDEYAQQGNLGILIYNRKEGRSLGEVSKFMAYNTRKRQQGGDCKEKYFDATVQVASIRDARIQSLMPDPFLWLGIDTIDVWYSMSNEKSDAIRNVGIDIVEQREIPLDAIPEAAMIEINAKIDDGYYSGK